VAFSCVAGAAIISLFGRDGHHETMCDK